MSASSPEKRTQNRDRREARQELMKVFTTVARRRCGLCSTPGQIRAQARILADRYYKEQITPVVARIINETSVLSGQSSEGEATNGAA